MSDHDSGTREQFDPPNRRKITFGVGVLYILGIAATLVSAMPSFAKANDRLPAKIVLALVALAPPLWFHIEYHLVWRSAPVQTRPSFEQFKYGQETARNIWLAFVGILLTLYFQ